MANKYLNDTGLSYFYQKLQTVFQTKETGKGLSSNDYTTTEKNKLSGIDTGAQVNVIETVKKNGTTLTVTNKAVDISVPTNTSDLTNDSDFVEDSSYVHTDNNYTSTEKTKLSGIEEGAEVNQNAYGSLKYKTSSSASNWTTYNSADESDTLYFLPGTDITFSSAQGESSNKPALKINSSIPSMTVSEAETGTATKAKLISASVLHTVIANAVAGITQISYEVVQTLPSTGSVGVIYLVSHGPGTQDIYDEYIWVGSSYEKIGSTDIDLTDYMKKTDMTAITTSEIDTLFA